MKLHLQFERSENRMLFGCELWQPTGEVVNSVKQPFIVAVASGMLVGGTIARLDAASLFDATGLGQGDATCPSSRAPSQCHQCKLARPSHGQSPKNGVAVSKQSRTRKIRDLVRPTYRSVILGISSTSVRTVSLHRNSPDHQVLRICVDLGKMLGESTALDRVSLK